MAKRKTVQVIATLPPYAAHRAAVIGSPLVDELRFNTVWEIGVPEREMLKRLSDECGDKPLWIDLKGRQLRITHYANMPYAFLRVSHPVEVDLPCDILFKDCAARIVDIVGGDKLILDGPPEYVVGIGQPVNILHPSLRIKGTLTDSDKRYIEAANELGLDRFMLSFVESAADASELMRAVAAKAPKAVLKIESPGGLRYIRKRALLGFGGQMRLMAARDDLFIQLGRDGARYLKALGQIAKYDKTAIAASRILQSLEKGSELAASDVADLELLWRLGYRHFMLSDGISQRVEAFRRVMAVFAGLAEEWRERK